jgi:quercetin dioxygenase-like cupin family protein
MQNQKGKPTVVPSNDGRKMFVLGQEITLKLAKPETGGDYYVFEVLTPPGVGVPPHVHQHEDEILQVIEGEFGVFLDGKTHKATQGAVFNCPRFIPHGFSNIGKNPGRTLFTVIPGTNFEQFFEELSALPADRPPDMAKVAAIFKRYDIEILASSSA